MNKIYIYGADKLAVIDNKKRVKQALLALFEEEDTGLERLNFIFCSDDFLLSINKQYLNHDFLTDVITFPLSGENEPVYGEVYMSVDRIKDNAKVFNVTYQNELLRVMFHGALHLCGYIDTTKAAKLKMKERENYYLNKFNVSREANS